jgi:bifunctional UDP-N-acetylglucosamine pyrophosphorylase/glucosamine-1-phosphate N-acetyltransferase
VAATSEQAQPSQRGLAAIILAAGRSTRMKTDRAKVMHEVCGRPMLAYVLDACRGAEITDYYLVVGFGKADIEQVFADEPGVRFVEQREQKGTGHAVMMCAEALKGFHGDVVVIAGDMPMIRAATLLDLIGSHRATCAAASLATTQLDDPTGYGRIVRDAKGNFERIVEHRDCTPAQRAIHEVNPSYYCFDAGSLLEALPKLSNDNAKGEYYITDVLEILRREGKTVRASTSVPAGDATGINSRADLADVNRLMQQRITATWMDAGVTIVDPANTWIDSRATIGAETIVRPFTTIEGRVRIGAGCVVGPYAYLTDGAVVADGTTLGPGVLTALDGTLTDRRMSPAAAKKHVQITRRPPAVGGVESRAS